MMSESLCVTKTSVTAFLSHFKPTPLQVHAHVDQQPPSFCHDRLNRRLTVQQSLFTILVLICCPASYRVVE